MINPISCSVSVSIRGNMIGTQFTIFDNGDSPKNTRTLVPDGGNLRREIAAVLYVSNSLCFPHHLTSITFCFKIQNTKLGFKEME